MVFKDASAARAAQQALQASEERLRLALEGAELGAVDYDLRTGNAVWNDRLYAIVGYPLGTPVTAEMINLHTAPEDWEQVQRTLQQAKETHTPFRSEHRIVRANDKAVRWVASNGIFLYDKEGAGSGSSAWYAMLRSSGGSNPRYASRRSSMHWEHSPAALHTTSTTYWPCCAATWP